MTCGFCSEPGHNMRNCFSSAAQNLLGNYRRTCLIPRTDIELIAYLRSFTSDMLSIIMYSYGARSVSVNRQAKEQFIRERILHARNRAAQPALVIDLTVMNQNQPRFVPRSPVDPPPLAAAAAPPPPPQVIRQPAARRRQRVTDVRETMASYKARMKVIADALFTLICADGYGITRYTVDNSARFEEMIEMLSTTLIAETRNLMQDAVFVSKLITKQFHLQRAVAPTIKRLFFTTIYREHRRVSEVTIAGLRAQGLLPPAQQAFVPHKPQFAPIQMVHIDAPEAQDYCCGICSEDFTRSTIPTLNCEHTLCVECIAGQIKARSKSRIKCPFCREEVNQISVGDEIIRNQIHTLVTAEIAKN